MLLRTDEETGLAEQGGNDMNLHDPVEGIRRKTNTGRQGSQNMHFYYF